MTENFLAILAESKVELPSPRELPDGKACNDARQMLEGVREAVRTAYQCDLKLVTTHVPAVDDLDVSAWSVVLVKMKEHPVSHGTVANVLLRPEYPITLTWSEDGINLRHADCRDYEGLTSVVKTILACPRINRMFAAAQQG